VKQCHLPAAVRWKEIEMNEMQTQPNAMSRREVLKKAGFASVALMTLSTTSSVFSAGQSSPLAWLGAQEAEAAEGKKDVQEVLRANFGDRTIQPSHVMLKTPIIAENGAVVPVDIESDLPMEADNYVKKMYIFVDENAEPFIASVDLTPASGKAAYSLRIKMRQTSQVRAVVETNKGVLYGDTKTVKVTIGGCGG
jgi:sulfur-oxidizing protein SoxY